MARKWTQADVLEMARSYQTACVLAAAADHQVFDIISDRPKTAKEVADAASGDPRAMTILLDALSAIGLLHKAEHRYALADGVGDTLTRDGRDSVLAMAQHQANCLRSWAHLSEVVRSGRPADRGPSIRGADADAAAFVEAMDNVSGPIAEKVIGDLPPVPFRHLLDVGGATGTWTIAWLRRNPDATATLFDLPHVIPQARERLAAAGLADRVTLAPGDYETGALPTGADLAWVSAIIHQNSREQNRKMFRALHAALAPGGRVLIRDVIMDPSRTRPTYGAIFAINMLVNTQAGGTFTLDEIKADLSAAGFANVEMLRPDEGMNSVVAAMKRE